MLSSGLAGVRQIELGGLRLRRGRELRPGSGGGGRERLVSSQGRRRDGDALRLGRDGLLRLDGGLLLREGSAVDLRSLRGACGSLPGLNRRALGGQGRLCLRGLRRRGGVGLVVGGLGGEVSLLRCGVRRGRLERGHVDGGGRAGEARCHLGPP